MTDHIHATRLQLNDAIVQAERSGNPGHATLLRAVRDRQIRLAFVGRDTLVGDAVLNRWQRPTVALVGDDDDAGTGLAGLRSWRRLQSWARCDLVHAAAADGTYALAVTVAATQGKMLFIETSSDRAQEWADALDAAFIPPISVGPKGGQHPVAPSSKIKAPDQPRTAGQLPVRKHRRPHITFRYFTWSFALEDNGRCSDSFVANALAKSLPLEGEA